MSTLICLMGPTASGKTDIALQLVKDFPFEIISVDSALVYKQMDIGTAKPSNAQLLQTPHHLINIRDPAHPYSAADFYQDALAAIKLIESKNKIPLLVGGTMLYFKVLQEGISDLPSADKKLRQTILEQAHTLGWPAMHKKLIDIDELAALRIHANDKQRIARALEIYALTGQPISELQNKEAFFNSDNIIVNIAVAPRDRAVLHDRIEKRFDLLLQNGFVEEVKQLFERGDLDLEKPAIRSVGYRQIWEYLQGNISYEEMREKGIIATRQLAKRQLTWLRSWPNLQWFYSENPKNYSAIKIYLESVLKE